LKNFDGHPYAAPGLRIVVPDCHVLGATIVPDYERVGPLRKTVVKIRVLHVLELFFTRSSGYLGISISEAS
jgi:hypothetical protein